MARDSVVHEVLFDEDDRLVYVDCLDSWKVMHCCHVRIPAYVVVV